MIAKKDTATILDKYKPTAQEASLINKWNIILNNLVSNQREEWVAFNNAFSINPDAAMKSCSIGMMQVMGEHYSELGFKTVGEMWDYSKASEKNQVEIAIRFIKNNQKLFKAVQSHDFKTIAFYYNGASYAKFKYDSRLQKAYQKYA